MTYTEFYYTICGFVLGFLVMLLFHISKMETLKKNQRQHTEEAEPIIHEPKYAAGSDIDSINYHYKEPKRENNDSLSHGIILIFRFLAYFISMTVVFLYIWYKIDTM